MSFTFLMFLTASFLFFCFLKFANDKRAYFRKCLIPVLLISPFVFWHFYDSESTHSNTLPNHGEIETRPTPAPLGTESSSSTLFISGDKWIVVTSIKNSTSPPQIETLSQIPGWKLVIVADKGTTLIGTNSNIILLDETTQLTLGYNILQHLPRNSEARKAIGYLFAIQNGAQIIFDADLNTYSQITKGDYLDNHFSLNKNTARGLLLSQYQDALLANPYRHFGHESSYPRGYPVQLIDQEYNNTYTVCPNISTPSIQQGIVGGPNLDVDSYWRLLHESSGNTTLNVQFDPFAPPVIYPKNLFAPFNSKNTIFRYNAFWGLVQPPSLPNRVSDIWRGCWAQRLLWTINGNLGFHSVQPTFAADDENLERNVSNFDSLSHVREEVRIHTQALDLVQLLANWTCASQKFYDCVIDLSRTMAEKGTWSWKDVKLIEAWIKDLQLIGYTEPVMVFSSNNVSSSACWDDKGESIAVFYPVDGTTIRQKRQENRESLREFCNFTEPVMAPTKNDTEQGQNSSVLFPSTLLVVTFNEVSRCKNIWLLDIIYRPAYPNIVYCVPFENPKVFANFAFSPEFTNVGLSKFSVVRANTTSGGNFAYECTLRAIAMNYGVTEYFVLQDDVLLNYWNNVQFDSDEMWIYRSKESILDTRVPYGDPTWSGWGWWRSQFGLNVTKEALKFIYESDNEAVKQYRENRKSFGYNDTVTMYGETDSYHVPGDKKEIFYQVGSILRKFEVYMEIGVHLIMSGLSSPKNAVIFRGVSLWGGERNDPLKNYNESESVIHPLKLSQVIGNLTFRAEYCDKYVRKVLEFG